MRARYLWPLFGITILAAALRFSTLGVQSYWHDEAVTALRVLKPSLGDTLRAVSGSESTPPLYYVLAWAWAKLFGTAEVGLRSLSALFGTATVPVAYLLASRLISKRAALGVAALVAVSPWLVWYSQEARSYALLVLLSGLSLVAFVNAITEPTPKRLAVWAVVSSLAVSTHYFAVFTVVPEAVWLLLAHRWRFPILASVLGTATCCLALMPLALHQAEPNRTRWISQTGLLHRILDVPKKFLTGEHGSPVPELAVLVGFFVLIGLWLAVKRSDDPEQRGARMALALGGVSLAAPLALTLVGTDLFIARNVIAAWLPLAVVVAGGFGVKRAGELGTLTGAALLAISLAITISVEVNPRLQRADWRDAAKALTSEDGYRAIVTPFVGDDPLKYYLPRTSQMPVGGATVSEVDLLGWPAARTGVPQAPARGFSEVDHRKIETLTLIRFRSKRPVKVLPRELAKHHLGPLRAAVLIEKASSGKLPRPPL